MGDEAKLAHIRARLEEDLSSVDFQLSLLVAALSSYKHDSLLKPFPPMFADEGYEFKDYASMVRSQTFAIGVLCRKRIF